MKESVAFILLATVTVKFVFLFLGWLSRDGYDCLYRRQLDQSWDLLQEKSIRQVFLSAYTDILNRINASKWFYIRMLILTSFMINLLCIGMGPRFWQFYINGDFTNPIYNLFSDMLCQSAMELGTTATALEALMMYAFFVSFFSIVGTISDFFSGAISWLLLRTIAKNPNLTQIVLHFSLDIGFCLLACFWPFILVFFTTESESILRLMAHLFNRYPVLIYASGLLGLSTAIPTFLYSIALLFTLSLFLMPKSLKTIVVKVIYLISTDEKPVLAQVGTVMAVLAGFLVAIYRLLNNT